MGVSTSKEYKREWARKRMKDPAYRALHRKRNREYMRRKRESDPAKIAEWRHRGALYVVWANMLKRVGLKYKATPKEIKDYASRGISVCDQWREFGPFRDWALDNGYKRGLFIDRIDNDSGYSPDNCRFVTRKENNRNTRATIFVQYKGETRKFIELWEELHHPSVSYSCAYSRFAHLGCEAERAITTPKGQK